MIRPYLDIEWRNDVSSYTSRLKDSFYFPKFKTFGYVYTFTDIKGEYELTLKSTHTLRSNLY